MMEDSQTPTTTSRRIYFLVYLALLALLAATVGVAYLNLGPFNWVAAVAIASVKAILVVLFFMHARHNDIPTRIYIIAGFFWLAILIGLTLSDYLTRIWIPHIGG